MKIYRSGLNHQKGFTLIELLVVVVIIGLLTTVATTNYMTSQAKARDGARKTQVNSIASAIETFYAVKKKFPGKGPVTDRSIYNSDYLASSKGCEDIIDSDVNIPTVPTQKFYIEYSYKPLADARKCNKIISSSSLFTPDQYSPSPTWIPEMGDYLSPAPVDKQYLSSAGNQGVNSDSYISMLDGKNGSNKTRTYAYMKLESGYAIYTKLETQGDKDALNGKIQISCENAGFNFDTTDEFCYTSSSKTPILPLKITNDNLYLVRR